MLWRSIYLSARTANYTKILVSVNTFETITKLLHNVPEPSEDISESHFDPV